jgi:peptidoglycan/LPS O-acetylase OafA/YrhL
MKLSYRREIDGLRAFAVSFVLLFHFYPTALKGGFIGVDVFFVISGYLITSILSIGIAEGHFSIARFYGYRIRRIFPALLLVLIFTAVFAWLFLYPDEYAAIAKHVAGGAAFIANFVLWGESGYFEWQAHQKPLTHLWSLGIEEQFYIVWPIALLLITRWAGRFRLGLITLLAGVSLAYCIIVTAHNSIMAFYSPLSRSWELMAGAMLALSHEQLRDKLQAQYLKYASNIGFTLLLVLPFVIRGGDGFPGWRAFFPVLASLLIILGGQAGAAGSKVLSHPRVVYLGLISYPLYLWHWVILVLWKLLEPNPSRTARLIGIVISVLLAHLTYRFVEKPIRNRSVSPRLVAILGGLMAIVLVTSFSSYKWGFLVREISPLRAALTKVPDIEKAYRSKICFLDSKTQTAASFAPECMPALKAGTRSLLIWGDSLAAHLYPGIESVSEKYHLTVSQRTASSCPPGMAEDLAHNGNCDDINADTRRYIEATRPYTVVINGRWENGDRPTAEHIQAIVAFLKKNGVNKIVLVGPAPRWFPDLRVQLLEQRFANNEIPTKMAMAPSDWILLRGRDKALADIARDAGISYLSPLNEFCTDGLCLIRVSDNLPDGLLVVDTDHFTRDASIKLFHSKSAEGLFD